MSIGRFIAVESNDEHSVEDAEMEQAAQECTRVVLESQALDFHETALEDAAKHLGMEAFDDYDDVSENSLENKGDFFQQFVDKVNEDITDFTSKIRNPIANFFTGVNRTLSKTDKLLDQLNTANSSPRNTGAIFSSNKGFNKLRTDGELPETVEELTKNVQTLVKYGEWLMNDYRSGINDLALGFADALRDRKKNKWFDKEGAVNYFVSFFESRGFPIAPNAKPNSDRNRLYKELTTPGILGDSEISEFVLQYDMLDNVEGWQKLNMISSQWLSVRKFSGKMGGNERINIKVGNKSALTNLLHESEKLVNLAKKMSNELKAIESPKVLSKINVSFIDFWDHLLNSGIPISVFRYIITGVRRSLFSFFRAYSRWSTQSYSSYIKNAYDVGSTVNKLVEKMLKYY